jgi:hypothetical protein
MRRAGNSELELRDRYGVSLAPGAGHRSIGVSLDHGRERLRVRRAPHRGRPAAAGRGHARSWRRSPVGPRFRGHRGAARRSAGVRRRFRASRGGRRGSRFGVSVPGLLRGGAPRGHRPVGPGLPAGTIGAAAARARVRHAGTARFPRFGGPAAVPGRAARILHPDHQRTLPCPVWRPVTHPEVQRARPGAARRAARGDA